MVIYIAPFVKLSKVPIYHVRLVNMWYRNLQCSSLNQLYIKSFISTSKPSGKIITLCEYMVIYIAPFVKLSKALQFIQNLERADAADVRKLQQILFIKIKNTLGMCQNLPNDQMSALNV